MRWAWSANPVAAATSATAAPPARARRAARTKELFATGDDDANRAAVRAVAAESLVLAGIAVYGPRIAVDKVCRGLTLLHP